MLAVQRRSQLQHAGEFQRGQAARRAAFADRGKSGDGRDRRIKPAGRIVEAVEDQRVQHGEAVASECAVLLAWPARAAFEVARAVLQLDGDLLRHRLPLHRLRGAVAPARGGGIGPERARRDRRGPAGWV